MCVWVWVGGWAVGWAGLDWAGFDFLRDNLALSSEEVVLLKRPLDKIYCLVDEVRVPLSMPCQELLLWPIVLMLCCVGRRTRS
jgi:hypothetical protein